MDGMATSRCLSTPPETYNYEDERPTRLRPVNVHTANTISQMATRMLEHTHTHQQQVR